MLRFSCKRERQHRDKYGIYKTNETDGWGRWQYYLFSRKIFYVYVQSFMKITFLGLLLLALNPAAFAQPVVSPEVHGDGSVTFRLKAPDAKEVQLHCETVKETNMVKGVEGVWSFTTRPLEPDFYVYAF